VFTTLGRGYLPSQFRHVVCARPCAPAEQASICDARSPAPQLIPTLVSCPVAQVARVGGTLAIWRGGYLASFDTGRASATKSRRRRHQRIPSGSLTTAMKQQLTT
jgi:hypothetical protein